MLKDREVEIQQEDFQEIPQPSQPEISTEVDHPDKPNDKS